MIEFIEREKPGYIPMEYVPQAPERQEMILRDTGTAVAQMAEQVAGMAAQMTQQMAAMAEMMRITNERMTELEKTVRTLEKVTPRQIGEINLAIRERAKETCEDYLVEKGEKAVAAAIRKEIRKMTGVQTTREICRCDAGTVITFIREWDEPETMRKIRKKVDGR